MNYEMISDHSQTDLSELPPDFNRQHVWLDSKRITHKYSPTLKFLQLKRLSDP